MGKQCIILKYCIYMTLMGRIGDYINPIQINRSSGWVLKACDNSKQSGLPATRRSQQGEKFPFINIKRDILYYIEVSERLTYVHQPYRAAIHGNFAPLKKCKQNCTLQFYIEAQK
jgi:hypothetical protein